jgi:hypothetical protein
MTSVVDLAKLSDAVYTDKVKVGQWLRIGLPFTQQGSGFKSALFQHMESNDYALAIAGTSPTEFDDLKSDAQLALGLMPNQYRVARSAYFAVAAVSGGFGGLYITGHSLGGGLASMLAKEHGDPTVTFNAPGMARAFANLQSKEPGLSVCEDKDRKIIHICAFFDVVSRGTGKHLGGANTVKRIKTNPFGLKEAAIGAVGTLLSGGNLLVGGVAAAGATALKAHGMTRMLPVLEKRKDYCEPLDWV